MSFFLFFFSRFIMAMASAAHCCCSRLHFNWCSWQDDSTNAGNPSRQDTAVVYRFWLKDLNPGIHGIRQLASSPPWWNGPSRSISSCQFHCIWRCEHGTGEECWKQEQDWTLFIPGAGLLVRDEETNGTVASWHRTWGWVWRQKTWTGKGLWAESENRKREQHSHSLQKWRLRWDARHAIFMPVPWKICHPDVIVLLEGGEGGASSKSLY